MDLEAKLATVGDAPGFAPRPGAAAGGDGRMIPRAPAKACLSGHRAPITCVCTHPVYRFMI